jgi:Tol biopolymer transport system component
MPEVQEVFRMATQKVGPDARFLERQQRRQRRRARNRKLGPYVLVAAIVAALVTFALIQNSEKGNVPLTSNTPSPTRALPQGGFPTRYVDVRTGETRPGPVIPEEDLWEFSVSADGTVVAFVAPDTSSAVFKEIIYVGDIDGTSVSNIRPLEKASSTRAEDLFDLEMSPDGSKIVYQLQPNSTQEEGDLYVVDVGTGETTQITHLKQISSDYWAMAPSFSPDGKTVLFNAPRASQTPGTWDLYSVPARGGKPTLVRPNAVIGSYSPDGTRIAYHEPGTVGSKDLFVANADGTNPRRLVKGEFGWRTSWSPDGARIAFMDAATNDVLYVVDVESGRTSKVGNYGMALWVDDHTMITDQQ